MGRKQMLKNSISYKDGIYRLTYFVDVDGMEREIGKFEHERLDAIIACRELLANLPSLQAKLEALTDLETWFNGQLTKIDQRIKTPKTKKTTKKEKTEDKDAILRDFLKKLGK